MRKKILLALVGLAAALIGWRPVDAYTADSNPFGGVNLNPGFYAAADFQPTVTYSGLGTIFLQIEYFYDAHDGTVTLNSARYGVYSQNADPFYYYATVQGGISADYGGAPSPTCQSGPCMGQSPIVSYSFWCVTKAPNGLCAVGEIDSTITYTMLGKQVHPKIQVKSDGSAVLVSQ